MNNKIPVLLNAEIWNSEFGHLQGSCYLDQTGSALYAKSQVEAVAKDLCEHLYTNPHSNNLSSKLCGDIVDQVRYRILQYFNTTTNDYSVIFTSGATAALKLVAESFDFNGTYSKDSTLAINDSAKCSGSLIYLQENHTSVLGMRNVDNIIHNSVPVRSISQAEAFCLFNINNDTSSIEADKKNQSLQGNSLFVFPAQCNFSGLKYPLSWIEKVHKGVIQEHQNQARNEWFCLLDAATYVSTNPLDLSWVRPDFVTISFYKMWGLPTGLGALLVRNSSAHVLHKTYFGGGTVQVALPSKPVQVFRSKHHERFEDGTINFLSICGIRHGLDWQERAGLRIEAVALYCFTLARYTYSKLCSLHHSNGQPAVRIYADTRYDDPLTQGGIVNFNLLRDTGDMIGYFEVLTMANLHNIHLRAGCFCNPGACQRHLGMTEEQYYSNFEAGHVCGDDVDLIDGQPTGSLRVSFGPYSRQEDADRLILMLSECFLTKPTTNGALKKLEYIVETPNNSFDDKNSLVEDKEQTEHRNSVQNGKSRVHGKFNPYSDERIRMEDQKMEEPSRRELYYTDPDISTTSITEGFETRLAPIHISQICVYPIKSCGAFEVCRWPLDHRGLLYDRCWMVVTEAGVALTQKQEPRLCVIKPIIDLDKKTLTLTSKGYSSCSIPLESPSCGVAEASLCHSKVCGDNVRGVHCGSHVAEWLNDVLGRTGLRLLQQSDVNHRSTKSKDRVTDETGFSLALSNQAQFLLINENSVSWVGDKLSADSRCSKNSILGRFRSNLAIKGSCLPFEEQKWKAVQIGSIKFIIEGPCSRCQMICIDQSTGEKTKEPLTTLAANCKGKVKFGIYLRYENYTNGNYVSIGDGVVPLVT